MKNKDYLVQGFGINDSEEIITWRIDGKKYFCPYYSKWRGALSRCNNTNGLSPTYEDCEVSLDWKYFTDFKKWATVASFGRPKDLDLDKDILVKGNRIYSPETCVFVPSYVNRVLVDNRSNRGTLPWGVSYSPKDKRSKSERIKPYRVEITSFNKRTWLGNFFTPEEAHAVWQLNKAEAIEKVINKYATEFCFDERVADALMARVIQLKLECNLKVETISI